MKTKGLFRGKPTEEYKEFLQCWKEYCKDGFIFGSLIKTEDNRCFICITAMCSHKSIINNGITTMCEVIPETVGRFTGCYDKTKWDDLTDSEKREFYFLVRSDDGKNITYPDIESVQRLWKGKPIYEGDILKHYNDSEEGFDIGEIYYDKDFVGWRRTTQGRFLKSAVILTYKINPSCIYEVIGDIHNNPELMEVKT